MKKKFKNTMPMVVPDGTKMADDICAQCGWRRGDHKRDDSGTPYFCYHYSDEDTDYFYKDRGFVPISPGKEHSRSFNGKIIE